MDAHLIIIADLKRPVSKTRHDVASHQGLITQIDAHMHDSVAVLFRNRRHFFTGRNIAEAHDSKWVELGLEHFLVKVEGLFAGAIKVEVRV